MNTNFHHGPEVIEHREGATIVRDVASAVTYVNGTAPIGEVHDSAEKRADYINQRKIVRTREDAAQFGPEQSGFTIPQALDAIFDEADGGTIVVNNVFDPDKHSNVADVTIAEINGEVDASGMASGMFGALECYNRFGYFPKNLLSAASSNPAVRVQMDSLAHKLNAIAFCDLPIGLTKQQAVEARGAEGIFNANIASERVVLCYPHIKVEDKINGGERLDPLSQNVVGVLINTDQTEGYHHSFSNRPIKRALGGEVDINFYPGDYQSDTNFLNEAGIVTYMRSFATGFNTFGNRSSIFPSSSDVRNFIHARRILDMTHDAIISFTMQYVDRNGDPARIERAEEAVNAYLRKKVGDGVFYGATFRFDRQKNTAEEIADGHFHYVLDSHPISVMERITTHSYVDTKFISNALALAA